MIKGSIFGAGLAFLLAGGLAQAGDAAGLQRGKDVYQLWCWNCHGSGPGKPATAALKVKYGSGTPAVLEERTDLTPEHIKAVVRHGLATMPFTRKTEISDGDLDLLVLYLTQNNKPAPAGAGDSRQ